MPSHPGHARPGRTDAPPSFQQKIGAGLTTERFQKKADDGVVRHVGLTESIAMIADALGWTLDRISDDVHAKLATVTISSEFLAVDPGYVWGIVQDGVGYRKGQPVIRLHLEAYLGAPDAYDRSTSRGLRACRSAVCEGADFYTRKDFDPKVGLAVVIVGAAISAVFYWYERDLIAYSSWLSPR